MAPENGAGNGAEGCSVHPRERRAGWDISSHGIPMSRDVQQGGPSLHPDPPGIPQPTLASAVLAVRCVGGLAARC